MILGAQPSIFLFWLYWEIDPNFSLTFFIFFPIILFSGIILLAISSAILARIFIYIVNSFHKPRQGIFEFNREDKDYCYWSLRSILKKWPIWIARQLSIPLFEKLILKILGCKISFSSAFHDGWIDTEFVEIGKNVKLGQGSLLSSFLIVKGKLIIKKVKVEDNVVIGAHSILLPGTIAKRNSTIAVNSSTNVSQILEENSTYSGSPAKKVFKKTKQINMKDLRERIFKKFEEPRVNPEHLKGHVKELSVPFYKYLISGWIISGMSFILPGFIFIVYVFLYLVPFLSTTTISLQNLLNTWNLLTLFTIPIVFIALYLFHLFFVALFTRWFYKFADKRGPKQGLFDRNLDKSSKMLEYYHFRSFLLKYPIFAVTRSPFPWLTNWELRFIGSNEIGKNSIIEESFLHSHIKLGKKCYLGTFTHITNHLVDGIYGQENLTFFGSELGNKVIFNSISGGFPGMEIGKNSTFLSVGSTVKYDKLGENNIYSGFPARKLNRERIKMRLGDLYDGGE
ncbi:MAG: hypothetical protein P8Y70_08825 [Candidatus Lokiarchaeota archaeon]